MAKSTKQKIAEELQRFGRQAKQGSTLGFADELQDVLGAAIAYPFTRDTGLTYAQLLSDARDLSREQLDEDWAVSPVTSFAGQATGGIPLGFTKAGQAAANWIRGGSALSGIGRGAAVGAGYGGLAGMGAADDTVSDRAFGLGGGAAIGAALGGVTAPLARMGISPDDVDYRKVVKQTAKGFDNKAQQELARQLSARPDLPEQLARAETVAQAAQRSGIPLTLAETVAQSGSDPLLAQQAVLGSNPMTAGRIGQMYTARSGTPQQSGQIENRLMMLAQQLDPSVGSYDDAARAVIGQADEAQRGITNKLTAQAKPLYDEAYKKSLPETVYHGTNEVFDNFDIKKAGKTDEGFAGKGVYFTNDKEIAGEYGENIIKAKLNLKNPLIVTNYDEVANIAEVETKRPKGMNDRKIWSETVTKNLQDKGYDGVFIKDTDLSTNKPVNEFVVFDVSNINKTDGDILQNPLIQSALQKARSNPVYAQEIGDLPDNSIQALDAVKRSLDDMAEAARRQGNRNESRLINSAKTKLLQEMDEAAPEYAQARQIYSGNPDALQMRERIGALADIDPMNAKKVGQQLFSGTQQNADLAAQALGDRAPTAVATRIYGAMDELRNDPVNIASRIAPDQRTSDMIRSYAGSQYQPIEETLNVINQAKLGERVRHGSPTQPLMKAEQGLQEAAGGALNAAVDVKTGGATAIVRKVSQMLGRGKEQTDPQFYSDMADLMLTDQGMDLLRRVASGQQNAIQELQQVGLPSLVTGGSARVLASPVGRAGISGIMTPAQPQSQVFVDRQNQPMMDLPEGFVIQNQQRPMRELPDGFVIKGE